MRGLAFACFVLAAFAWVPPWLDRWGIASLGLACLAYSVGRVPGVTRPSLFAPREPAGYDVMPEAEPTRATLPTRLAPYGEEG